MITFVRETENLDFAEAVEWLAERFRVNLEYEETSPQLEESRKRRDRLHAVLEQAASFYERHLWETAGGAPVREYLASRRLGEPAFVSSASVSRREAASRRRRSRRGSREMNCAPRG